MEKKIVHGFSIPLTHITPIDHNDMSLFKVIHCKDLPKAVDQVKKSYSQRSLGLSNTLQIKRNAIISNKDIIEGANNEHLFFRWGPQKLVFTFPSHSIGIQQIEERNKDIHLLIVSRSNKAYVPLNKGNHYKAPNELLRKHPSDKQYCINP